MRAKGLIGIDLYLLTGNWKRHDVQAMLVAKEILYNLIGARKTPLEGKGGGWGSESCSRAKPTSPSVWGGNDGAEEIADGFMAVCRATDWVGGGCLFPGCGV